jgi:hypothetical protein
MCTHTFVCVCVCVYTHTYNTHTHIHTDRVGHDALQDLALCEGVGALNHGDYDAVELLEQLIADALTRRGVTPHWFRV